MGIGPIVEFSLTSLLKALRIYTEVKTPQLLHYDFRCSFKCGLHCIITPLIILELHWFRRNLQRLISRHLHLDQSPF